MAERTDRTSEPVDGSDPPTMAEGSEREESRLLRWDAALRRAAAQEERAEAAGQRAEAARQRAEAARQRSETAHEEAHLAELRAGAARKRVETLGADLDRFLEGLGNALPGLDASRWEAAGARSERAADDREQVADQRERLADEREAEADERDVEADEREHLADRRDAEADERERLADEHATRLRRGRTPSGQPMGSPPPPGNAVEAHRRHVVDEAERLRRQAAAVSESLADEAELTAAAFEDSAPRQDQEWRTRVAATEREIAGTLRRNADKLRRPGGPHLRLERLARLPSKSKESVHDDAPDGPARRRD